MLENILAETATIAMQIDVTTVVTQADVATAVSQVDGSAVARELGNAFGNGSFLLEPPQTGNPCGGFNDEPFCQYIGQ